MAVDPKSECPVDLMLTPASASDGEPALPLIENLSKRGYVSKYYIMDAGYDWGEIYRTIFEVYKGQAIIPMNRRNEKQPPIGIDFDGTVLFGGIPDDLLGRWKISSWYYTRITQQNQKKV